MESDSIWISLANTEIMLEPSAIVTHSLPHNAHTIVKKMVCLGFWMSL